VKLYTIGYVGRTPEALARALDELPNALLVDVRLVPFARDHEWARGALARRFGARYLHLRAFGNVNYKRDGAPVQLEDEAQGVRRLLAATRPMLGSGEPTVVLLCACRRRESCHRDKVAGVLVRQLGAEDRGELSARSGPVVPSSQLGLW
jgi:uncharacterized protein (DUF488 family)